MKAQQVGSSFSITDTSDCAPRRFPFEKWVLGSNPSIRRVARNVERAAEVECTVLLVGETGTGKEIWARLIHQMGDRADRPLIPVNCAALTPTLAESQLFGHEKGAFTGAYGSSLGAFRSANGGIIFLDEIGEMPLQLQPKLLRVLQQREVTPVGSSEPKPVDVQVVAATNRDLEDAVEEGSFREDLFFRLNMCLLRIPSLRERVEDIPAFIDYFSARFAKQYSRPRWRPSDESLRQFCEYPWPGNIRQLAHVIEQSYVLDTEPSLPTGRLSSSASPSLPYVNLQRLRAVAVRQALQTTRGHKGRAAKLLGVHANTLTRFLAELENQDDSASQR